MVTSSEKFVFASHICKQKIRNKARDFPKPITSKTLLIYEFLVEDAASALQPFSLIFGTHFD